MVTLKRGAVSSQGDHLPPLAGQPGHFLGALLLSQIGNIPLPKQAEPTRHDVARLFAQQVEAVKQVVRP